MTNIRIDVDGDSPLYHQHEETIDHLLKDVYLYNLSVEYKGKLSKSYLLWHPFN